jgi:hypothetical protein
VQFLCFTGVLYPVVLLGMDIIFRKC